jgi:ketosteroid isomerase-like protein
MTRLTTFIVTAALIAVPVAAANAGDPKADMEAAIAAAAAAYAGGDAATVAKVYTEDAALFPPNEARVDGRANIESYWKAAFDAGVSDIVLKTVETGASDAWGFEVGEFSYAAPDQSGTKVTGTGKFISRP